MDGNAGELRIHPLEPSMADELEAMTFPRFRHLLLMFPAPRFPGDGDRRNVIATGMVARVGAQPVGLALAATPQDAPAEAELLSLFVDPEWRGRGVATALLAALESQLVARGTVRIEGTYMTGKPAIQALERVLEKRGWEKPSIRTVSVKFTPEEARKTPWYRRTLLPRGGEIFAWRDATPEELARLQQGHDASPWIAEGLEPWAHAQAGFDPASSVGLRYKGEIVGWVINHRIWKETIRFTCSFMRPDLARRAAILPLYVAAIERAAEAGYQYCTFITPVRYKEMVDFVVNHCARWIGYVGETRGVGKDLRPGGTITGPEAGRQE